MYLDARGGPVALMVSNAEDHVVQDFQRVMAPQCLVYMEAACCTASVGPSLYSVNTILIHKQRVAECELHHGEAMVSGYNCVILSRVDFRLELPDIWHCVQTADGIV